jgi:hypothetical protein
MKVSNSPGGGLDHGDVGGSGPRSSAAPRIGGDGAAVHRKENKNSHSFPTKIGNILRWDVPGLELFLGGHGQECNCTMNR